MTRSSTGQLAVNSLSTRSASELALLAAVKLLLIALLLAAGWKGGHFYPMLFVATADGLCISQFVGAISPVVAVAAVSASVLAAVLRRVVAAAFLVLLMVPASMLVVSSVAAVVAFLALRLTARPARLRDQTRGEIGPGTPGTFAQDGDIEGERQHQ